MSKMQKYDHKMLEGRKEGGNKGGVTEEKET